jgi:hypothetical protein
LSKLNSNFNTGIQCGNVLCVKMKGKKKDTGNASSGCSDENAMPPQPGKTKQVRYRDVPETPPANKKIHPRQTPPPLPKGAYVPDEDPSPSLGLD